MSLQRLKIKKSKYSDTYSKNPILNSLIKQKLQGQIQHIRQSTIKVIHKNQQFNNKQKTQSQLQPRRMKSLSSLTMNKVKQSLYFDPLMMDNLHKDKQAVLFVQNRQIQTPLIQPQKLKSVIQARTRPEQLQIKMSARDKYDYERINKKQRINQIQSQIKDSVKGISSQLWLPQQAEVQQMFKNDTIEQQYLKRVQKDLQSFRQKSHFIQSSGNSLNILNKTHKNGQDKDSLDNKLLKSNYCYSLSNQHEKLKPLRVLGYEGSNFEVNYNAKKYHKNDYINLDEFLKDSLASSMINQAINSSQHLSKSYVIYLSTWKELIRLTYIQNWQKGLLMQKILWSFIRLLRRIIQCQHSVNYQQFKQQAQLLKQTKAMYENRMQKLDKSLKQKSAQLLSIKRQQKKLLLTIVSFQKVNRQLSQDLEKKTTGLERKKQQLSYIQHKYHGLLNQLVQNDMIYNDEKKFYIINKYHQPQMLINMIDRGGNKLNGQQIYAQQKLKNKDKKNLSPNKNAGKYVDLPQSVKLNFPNLQHETNQQKYQFTRYGKKIKKLQNQLNKYWQKKEDDLQLKAILQTIIDVRVADMAVQTDQKVLVQISTQIGQQNEQEKFDFQKYLSQKIQQERSFWKTKNNQTNDLYISLQQLYQDNQKQIDQLISIKCQQVQQIKSLKTQASELTNSLSNKTAQMYMLQQKMNQKSKQFKDINNGLNTKILQLQQRVKDLQTAKAKLQKDLRGQKDNNEVLVRKNVDADMKIRKVQKDKQKIIQKIIGVAPWLQKFMESIDSIQDSGLFNLYSNISKKIQQFLGQYVQRDANVFNLTK